MRAVLLICERGRSLPLGVACCVFHEADFCEHAKVATLISIVRCPCVLSRRFFSAAFGSISLLLYSHMSIVGIEELPRTKRKARPLVLYIPQSVVLLIAIGFFGEAEIITRVPLGFSFALCIHNSL